MRALLITPSKLRGGVEEYTLTLASAAVRQGWDVHVAFPKTQETASLIQDCVTQGASYHRLNIAETNVYKLKALIQYLPHFIRTLVLLIRVQPDVVHIVLPNPNRCLASLLACGVLRMPTAVTFQLVPFKWKFGTLKLNLYAWVRARHQQWIAVSDNNRTLIAESFHCSKDEIIRIYNGIDVAPIDRHTQPDLRSQLRTELNLPHTDRILLTVGRLTAQKGYSDLIPAIPQIVKEFSDVMFVWVGDGDQRDELASQVQAHGIADRVLVLGYRSDVPQLLQAADLFIFPTRYEGAPFAIVEAMAHGLPIVTTDASGIPEVIEHHKHGVIVPTGDSDSLREAIAWALTHPDKMQQMALNAKDRAIDFSEDRMVKETLNVWQRLV